MTCMIRRANVDDAATLSSLARTTFVESFGHLYEAEDLHAFLDEAYDVGRQATILAHPDYAVWLLEADGRAVGHCAAGPCGLPHPDVRDGDGEVKRLYVLREFHNGGWGARLMDTAMTWLQRDGARTLWVGVWSENVGAQRFYGRYGFEKVGTYGFPVGRVVDLEFVLRRPAAG